MNSPVLCSAPGCEDVAEFWPVLELRHKKNRPPQTVRIETPVCINHPPTWEIIIADGGFKTLADWIESQGGKRPKRKLSSLKFERIGGDGKLLDFVPRIITNTTH
jgi:hypothetical protein